MKKKWKVILILAVLACVFAAYIIYNQLTLKEEAIMRVGEHSISQDEFILIMDKEIAWVHNYFFHMHEVQTGELEWLDEYDGERPIEVLIDKTVEVLSTDLFVMEYANENGLTEEPLSIQSIIEDWGQNNGVEEVQGVVYGPTSKELYDYYDYILSELEYRVSDAILDNLTDKEEVLREFYEINKDEMFTKEAVWEGYRCYVDATVVDMVERLQQMHGRHDEFGQDVEAYVNQMRESGISVEDMSTNSEAKRYNETVFPELDAQIRTYESVGVTDIINGGFISEFAIITSVTPAGYHEFEEIRVGVEGGVKQQELSRQLEHWKEDNPTIIGEQTNSILLNYVKER